MQDNAHELLELGFSVIPLSKTSKLPPKGCTWKEQQNILPTADLIEQRFSMYPNANIGLITGRASNIIVIDADSIEAIKWIEENFPATWLTVTNNGRGKHFYFRYPKELNNGSSYVKTTSGQIYPNVDVRGHGGLIVLPPSIHESGNQYVWNIAEGYSLEDLDDLPECPVNITGILSTHSKPTTTTDIDGNKTQYASGNLQNVGSQCKWLQHCRTDTITLGYDEWRWMLSIVARCEDGREKAHKLSKQHPKYNYTETEKKITEVLNNMGPATCKTICSRFDGCFTCPNIGKGVKFSPILLGSESIVEPEFEIITSKDLDAEKQNLSLNLSDEIINPGGLISLGMEALRSSDLSDIPQYNYPIVVSILARAISGKLSCNGIWPNTYNIKVGGTSTGKSESDKILKQIIIYNGSFDNFFGPTDFSSGPGLLQGLVDNPQCLINIDESSYLFKRFDKPDPISAGKIKALLEIYTQSGLEVNVSYSNKKNCKKIEKPCVSIIGNATPGIFDNLKNEDFESGLLQRFDFFYYNGDIPLRRIKKKENYAMNKFLTGIDFIFNSDVPELSPLEQAIGREYNVEPDAECIKHLQQFSDDVVGQANQVEQDGEKGILSRQYHTAVKYALCHMASTGDIFRKMTTQDFNYGVQVANLLANWKITVLSQKINQGEFHQKCKIFIDAITAAIRINKKPTGKTLINRRPQLKNIKPREWDEIVKVLVAQKKIIIDDSQFSTLYSLIKNNDN
ncbi:MAG: bifunctional DNA primase/polymerase [Desulfosarcina sp.]|nr:bifunctional DNA primase/polymerase [Desulfobacterales bacterium]